MISSISDSGFISTTKQFIFFREIEAFSYVTTFQKTLGYYLLLNVVALPFSLADKTSPYYVSNITSLVSFSAVGVGLGTYALYKLHVQNGFRRTHKVDQRLFEMKYFRDISLVDLK